MSEKVCGFKEKDGYRGSRFTGRTREYFWQIKENDCIPVITIETHEAILNKEKNKWLEEALKND